MEISETNTVAVALEQVYSWGLIKRAGKIF